jgi:hypothetical protein
MMKPTLLFILVALQVIIGSNCFKISNPSLSVPYPANLQGNLHDTDLNELLYQKTLEAIAQEAQKYHDDSEEYSEDYLEYSEPISFNGIESRSNGNFELQSHSALGDGYQYIQGGAGEGEQHLQPDGSLHNKEVVKTDQDLPSYCNPPNPCPIGYKGPAGDCDPRPYKEFTAEFSKEYQQSQDCMCDDDHNDCNNYRKKKSNVKPLEDVNRLFDYFECLNIISK